MAEEEDEHSGYTVIDWELRDRNPREILEFDILRLLDLGYEVPPDGDEDEMHQIPIKGWTHYYVNRKGQLYNRDTGRYISGMGLSTINTNYFAVRLYRKGKSSSKLRGTREFKDVPIHRLVAVMFVKNPNRKKNLTVDHIDYDTFNNNYKNLRWLPLKENIRRREHQTRMYKEDGLWKFAFRNEDGEWEVDDKEYEEEADVWVHRWDWIRERAFERREKLLQKQLRPDKIMEPHLQPIRRAYLSHQQKLGKPKPDLPGVSGIRAETILRMYKSLAKKADGGAD
jgi:hypothetical protein